MEALTTFKNILKILNLYPSDEFDVKWKRVLFPLLMIIIFVGALIASIVFFVRFAQIDIQVSLNAVHQITGCSSVLFVEIVAVLLKHKIQPSIDNLQEIYNKCKIFLIS